MDNPPRLSLVAYTYNNARLADGLLAALAADFHYLRSDGS